MPSRSWPEIGRSCSEENQPASGTDIELCVAGSATSASVREHSARWPLQGPFGRRGGRGAARRHEGADHERDPHPRTHRRDQPPPRARALRLGRVLLGRRRPVDEPQHDADALVDQVDAGDGERERDHRVARDQQRHPGGDEQDAAHDAPGRALGLRHRHAEGAPHRLAEVDGPDQRRGRRGHHGAGAREDPPGRAQVAEERVVDPARPPPGPRAARRGRGRASGRPRRRRRRARPRRPRRRRAPRTRAAGRARARARPRRARAPAARAGSRGCARARRSARAARSGSRRRAAAAARAPSPRSGARAPGGSARSPPRGPSRRR